MEIIHIMGKTLSVILDVAVTIHSPNCDCTECLYKEWDTELRNYVSEVCDEKGIEEELVLGIIYNESRFQEDAVGSNTNGTYDYGLMQLNTVTYDFLHNSIGISSMDELLDPYTNIDAGTELLTYYYENSDSWEEALSKYQTGSGAYYAGYVHPSYDDVLGYREEYRDIISD